MFRKFLWIVVLLLVTNGATFLWGEMRLRRELAEADRRTEATARRVQERTDEVDHLRSELERLEAWGQLVDLQEAMQGIEEAIDRLNYGDALEAVRALRERVEKGELGALLAGSSAELAPRFDALEGALTSMEGEAKRRLRELGRAAFQTVAGLPAEADLPADPEETRPIPADPASVPAPEPELH